jgi:hypothetical protein
MIMLQGDENDRLSESPLFEKEKPDPQSTSVSNFGETEDLLEDVNLELINEIEEYVR